MRLLVCGGAGFIGSTFVRRRLADHGDDVTVLDKLTYAGRRENLDDVLDDIRFVHGAIEDQAAVAGAVSGCDAIVNFAAETHVDRSISGPEEFIMTNMQGTHVLLEAAREHGLRYLQVSTDEVYGSIEQRFLHRGFAATALQSVQRDQDGRRPARVQLLPHVRARGAYL